MAKTVVTGGAGFIGSHVAELLAQRALGGEAGEVGRQVNEWTQRRDAAPEGRVGTAVRGESRPPSGRGPT